LLDDDDVGQMLVTDGCERLAYWPSTRTRSTLPIGVGHGNDGGFTRHRARRGRSAHNLRRCEGGHTNYKIDTVDHEEFVKTDGGLVRIGSRRLVGKPCEKRVKMAGRRCPVVVQFMLQ